MKNISENALFMNAFNFAAIGMAIVSMEGTWLKVNSSLCRILGYSQSEFKQMKFQDITYPDDLDYDLTYLKRLIDGELQYYEIRKRYIQKDGSLVWGSLSVSLVKDKNDDPLYFIAQIQDITEQQRLKEKLYKSEGRYRALVEFSPNAIVVHQKGQIVYANPQFVRFLKLPTEAHLIGQHILQYVHPDYHEMVKERIDLLERNIPVEPLEEKYVRVDGSVVDVEVVASPIIYMDKPAFQIIINDISKRKKMEREWKESEERFRLLAEYSSDMITMHDVEGKYLYTSPACKEILQYAEEEMVGEDAYIFIHPDDQEMIKNHHQSLLKTGYTVSTYRIRRKDGEYVWFESAIKLLNELHSGEQKQIVVSRNISERKYVEQRLQEANALLQRISTIDGLTGVSNRRAFDERLELEWNRSRRNSTYLSLIMLDIDYFKAYNDTYGHQGGDGCLKQVASVIQETLGRSTDLLCRYGGEEFCIILSETDKTGAKTVGEKIRNVIEALKIPHTGSNILPWVTISVGTATMIPTAYTSYNELISNADKAVYNAKRNGRNCVQSFQ